MAVRKAVDAKTKEQVVLSPGFELAKFLRAALAILRPKQWIKNLFVFAGLGFLSTYLIFDFSFNRFWLLLNVLPISLYLALVMFRQVFVSIEYSETKRRYYAVLFV